MRKVIAMRTLISDQPFICPSKTSRISSRVRKSSPLLKTIKITAVIAALFTSVAAAAWASDPIGIYAFVDKVVFEPSAASPERVQVWGGFAIAEGRGETYESARRGYMYFKLKPGEEAICKKEWNDLKSIAGTAQIVGLGNRYKSKGEVRPPNAKPEKPDEYPIGFGLTKVGRAQSDYKPLKELRALQAL